ncbi:hypothetical protein TWF506_010326 [Arthrobotrys conoides]|uniref:Anaphase-promoting complex subunit 13 n=1 Tax=Arthrobotrys conoides TaxID=74498 RepID=A0AAN8NAW2_9PEZI
MSRDSNRTYVHFRLPRIVEQYEDYCRDKLPNDEVYVPPEHQPINPEDEDDVIPDQHAAFGIARAQQKEREPLWKDLNLADLLHRAPAEGDVPRIRAKFPR